MTVSVVIATYIGETGRNPKNRLTEHKRAVCNADTKNGIAVHVVKTDHTVRWDQASAIKAEPHTKKRKIKEALTIRKTANNMNLDLGLTLEKIWL